MPWYALSFKYDLSRHEHTALFRALGVAIYVIVPAGCGLPSALVSWLLWKKNGPRLRAWQLVLSAVAGGLLMAGVGYLVSLGLRVLIVDSMERGLAALFWTHWIDSLPFVAGCLGTFCGCGAWFGVHTGRSIWRYSLPALALLPVFWGLSCLR